MTEQSIAEAAAAAMSASDHHLRELGIEIVAVGPGTAVASGASIEFVSAAHVGDQLRADAKESHLAGRTGHYDITVSRDDTIIALFKGRSRRISDDATAP